MNVILAPDISVSRIALTIYCGLQESVLARLDDGAPIADIAQMVVDMADVKAPLKDVSASVFW